MEPLHKTSLCNPFLRTDHPNLVNFFRYFSKESTAHGIKYIGSQKLRPFERFIWIIITLTSLGFGILFARNVYTKFHESPVIISFQHEETSISQIPFPAITICNVNLLRTSIITDLYDDLVLLSNRFLDGEIELLQAFYDKFAHLDHLGQFCLQTKSFRRHLNEPLYDANGKPDFMEYLATILKNLNTNASALMQEAEENPDWVKEDLNIFRNSTIGCEDLLIKCMWEDDMIPCKDIFFNIETPNGHCCVFNMMPQFLLQEISQDDGRAQMEIKNMPTNTLLEWLLFAAGDLITNVREDVEKIKYPKHQKAGGKPYGLTVIANPNLNEYSTCTSNDGYGFQMVAHSPLSYPSIYEFGSAVPPRSEIFVDIEPDVIVANEDNLKYIPKNKRGCYLTTDPESELSSFSYYSVENCFSECVANHTYRNCSCVQFFMPRNATQKLCGAKKRWCADEVRVNLTKSIGKNDFCGHCLPFCEEITYKMTMTHFDRREDNSSSFISYMNSEGKQENATDYSIIHIFMGIDSFYAKERKKLYDWQDLLASAGGLVSLALGLSIISFIEVGYYFTLRAWFQLRTLIKQRSEISDEQMKPCKVHNNIHKAQSSVTTFGNATDDYYDWAVRHRLSSTGSIGDVTKRKVFVRGSRIKL